MNPSQLCLLRAFQTEYLEIMAILLRSLGNNFLEQGLTLPNRFSLSAVTSPWSLLQCSLGVIGNLPGLSGTGGLHIETF